jgi:hypothetical protein
MNQDTLEKLLMVAATAMIMWVMGWVRTFLARRVKVETPDAANIRKIIKSMGQLSAVQDAVMDTQILQTKAIKALLEASKGKINGNVDDALQMIKGADIQFNAFLRSRARPDMCDGDEQ